MVVRDFRDLIAWQKAMDFAELVYRETACFPREETYGLRGQVRSAAISIPSNIAEGQGRFSTNEFRHFLSIAHGSLCESQTQILMAERLAYISNETTGQLMLLSAEGSRLINGLADSLRRKSDPKR